MGTSRPDTLGGTIAVSDSDALELLVARGLPIGTLVFNQDVGLFFKLTISTAALIPDQVVEVFGIVGSRWIVQSPAVGGVASVTGDGVDNSDPSNPVIDLTNVIDASMLQTNAVTTAKITDANVTLAKMASNSVGTTQLVASSVTAAKLADTAVTPGSYVIASITVDQQGRITSAANGGPDAGITQLTGDVAAGPGS
jgi:hypothetical protein